MRSLPSNKKKILLRLLNFSDYEFVKTVTETAHMEDSIGLTMKAKKDITAPPEERPLFTKTLSGQTVERELYKTSLVCSQTIIYLI